MDRAPSYLSQTKAEGILSEVRPTKVKTDTLICVNVFLDELLWLVLSTARSFSTDRLKIGLLKALPTTLGKEALLEAELELKAYWEKTGPAALRALESSPSPSPTEFPLQAAFELLRHKCEAYSTLGEMDEDADAEARLQNRMLQAASNPPNSNAVAPAALYLTAVLEHVCMHILGNVARVVGRDASRSSAHVSDLNLALCEDETIYGLFRTMKVQEQIERQSKGSRPRRSKSISRGDSGPPSRTGSPNPQSPVDRNRSSADASGSYSASHPPSSSDKARAIKMFKNSTDAQLGKDHQRTTSVMSESTKRTMLAFQNQEAEDESGSQDFDDLMRSGTTMKVSLTPDRLKTFEVYNKQKVAKAAKANPPSANAEPAPPFKSLRPVASVKSIGRASELLDDKDASALSRNQRNHSIATPAEAGIKVNPQRRGSGSSTPPQTNSGLLRKSSLGNPMSSGPSAFQSANGRRNFDGPDMSNGMPKRNRPAGRGPARNRESLDLDDVMDVEDEIAFGPPPMTPKSAAPSGTSSSTRDLIDFLSEGPPDLPSLPPLQTNGLNDKPAKSGGRLRNMFSRVGRQPSQDTMSPSSLSPMQAKNMNGNGGALPLARSNSSLKKQRSAGNLTVPRPPPTQPFPPVDYPKPPQYARSSAPPSPTMSAASPPLPTSPPEPVPTNTHSERGRHMSVSRKAVPVWDAASQSLPVPSSTNGQRSPAEGRPSISPKPSSSSISNTQGTHLSTNVPTPTKESPISPSSPPTPSPSRRAGLVPGPRSAGIPNLPAAKASDVQDMRKRLTKATSAAEARLLVDLFLAQWGFSASKLTDADLTASDAPTPVTLDGGAEDDDHGVGIVEMLLGEGADESRAPVEEKPAQSHPMPRGHAISGTSSPTVSDMPQTPSSHYGTKVVTPGGRNMRIDVKQPSSIANGSASPSASASSGVGHSPMHHHRYGNASPVIVG